ncbi:unnamed protein product [Rotaria sp. Silwood2]|nr:unnamed protein product [Rotaria sp. Silwood2]CAF4515011.1 unnamed protein product [Rotaria sp. Silwood2]
MIVIDEDIPHALRSSNEAELEKKSILDVTKTAGYKKIFNASLNSGFCNSPLKYKYCQAVMFTATMTSSIYIGGIGKPAERVKLIIIMYS